MVSRLERGRAFAAPTSTPSALMKFFSNCECDGPVHLLALQTHPSALKFFQTASAMVPSTYSLSRHILGGSKQGVFKPLRRR